MAAATVGESVTTAVVVIRLITTIFTTIVIGAMSCYVAPVRAASSEPGSMIGTSTINSSVRALGMGDAYTSLADDSSSLFYNPAGSRASQALTLRCSV
ncbi:MAG: hypothetical protein HC902_10890 [Calothrix sp. SM1_5_4]|nr:hypothetical protein [Calothrix sp. SM1_5_4]